MAIQVEQELDLNGNKILNQGTPTVRTQGANKAYVDDTIQVFAFPPPNSFADSVGDGTSTIFTVVHNLKSKDVGVTVYSSDTGEEVDVDIVHDTIDAVVLTFGTAPNDNEFRVVIYGSAVLA